MSYRGKRKRVPDKASHAPANLSKTPRPPTFVLGVPNICSKGFAPKNKRLVLVVFFAQGFFNLSLDALERVVNGLDVTIELLSHFLVGLAFQVAMENLRL